jgi:serine/threonine protein kinase
VFGAAPPARSSTPILAAESASQITLADLIRNPCEGWWTATATAVVLIGTVLALIHGHDRGILHGGLNPDSIRLDEHHRPKLCSFGMKTGSVRNCTPKTKEMATKMDVFAFSLILCEVLADEVEAVAVDAKYFLKQAIAVGQSRFGNELLLPGVLEFMAKLIVKGLDENPIESPSIENIFYIFEAYEFKILSGVDSAAVDGFLIWVKNNQTSPSHFSENDRQTPRISHKLSLRMVLESGFHRRSND